MFTGFKHSRHLYAENCIRLLISPSYHQLSFTKNQGCRKQQNSQNDQRVDWV
jgi:hypothetical protein